MELYRAISMMKRRSIQEYNPQVRSIGHFKFTNSSYYKDTAYKISMAEYGVLPWNQWSANDIAIRVQPDHEAPLIKRWLGAGYLIEIDPVTNTLNVYVTKYESIQLGINILMSLLYLVHDPVLNADVNRVDALLARRLGEKPPAYNTSTLRNHLTREKNKVKKNGNQTDV